MFMSVIATNMAMEVAMLLVPEKTQVQRGRGEGQRRGEKGQEEKNSPW